MVIFWDDHENFLSGDILPKNKGDLGKKDWPGSSLPNWGILRFVIGLLFWEC